MAGEKKSSFFEGNFGKFLLPGILLQSVLIGGGYATGRETVSYGAQFGAKGWIAGIGIMIGFAIVALLTFELVRLYQCYDYKSMLKVLIGPLWPLYDVAYGVMMIIIIAVMASASGSIVEQTLGLNYWIGVALVIVVTGCLIFFGDSIIEKFETWGTVFLYVGYIIFTILVISQKGANIGTVFASGDTSYADSSSTGTIMWTGFIYMAYNLVIYPPAMFSLRRQKTRKETVVSGLIAGVLMTIPWFLTYFALMCFYPSADVLGADIPWLVMMQQSGLPVIFTAIFGIIMGWTLIETSTGIIHAAIGRVNVEMEERGKKKMGNKVQAVCAVVILVAACVMSRVGIIDLIEKGYSLLSYAFMLLYLLPLLTVGVYKILKKQPLGKKAE